ncbi:MAG: dihydroorotate dehydrogenase [Planctomycetes bacterium]|nr:dihydroorotate dehydrogenase [Planctomycetota bacterium]
MTRRTTRVPPAADPRLAVSLGPLRLRNPVMLASGTCGYGEEFAEFTPPGVLGAIVVKTVTRQPRDGNRPPRVCETASGMLNSIGLENGGIDYFCETLLPALRTYPTIRIVNIAGATTDDYVALAKRLDGEKGVDAIELNISCPNVAHGLDFATSPPQTTELVRAVRRATERPILVKLSPNVTDIVAVAKAALEGGADVLSLINTLQGMAIDWRRRAPRLGGITGGLSGPAIKPVALRMVWQVARAFPKAPIVGIGGIASADDALEFLVAGATAVQVGTASFLDPAAGRKVVEGLTKVVDDEKWESIESVRGTLKSSEAGPPA